MNNEKWVMRRMLLVNVKVVVRRASSKGVVKLVVKDDGPERTDRPSLGNAMPSASASFSKVHPPLRPGCNFHKLVTGHCLSSAASLLRGEVPSGRHGRGLCRQLPPHGDSVAPAPTPASRGQPPLRPRFKFHKLAAGDSLGSTSDDDGGESPFFPSTLLQ